jgi:hypothetical protein
MLLDDVMPQYDFSERHEKRVAAPKDAVRRAIDSWRPPRTPTRLLFALRRIPAPSGTLREWAASLGFLVLAETDDELVLGQIGRFWALNERTALVSPKTVDEFLRFEDPRYARTAMTVRVETLDSGETRLYTETRVQALGPGARRRFRLYWLLIRPFSGLLRHEMLRGIAKEARRIAAVTG